MSEFQKDNEFRENGKKVLVNYRINIIPTEHVDNKSYKEPFYIKDRRKSKSPARSNSSNNITHFRKMNKKELEIDTLITNKLKTTREFEDFISDPQIAELLKKND